jgi:hypothetical protein
VRKPALADEPSREALPFAGRQHGTVKQVRSALIVLVVACSRHGRWVDAREEHVSGVDRDGHAGNLGHEVGVEVERGVRDDLRPHEGGVVERAAAGTCRRGVGPKPR